MSRTLLLALLLAAPLGAQQPAAAAAAAGAAVPSTAAPFQVKRSGAGRPVILIPGLLSHGEVWDATVARFRDGHELHVLTLAGFAGAPPTGADPFLRTTRDAIVAYIREQRLDRPVIVGHSLGGFLALWLAATSPELVGPVVAVDGVPFMPALVDTTMTEARAQGQADGVRTIFAGMTAQALGAQTRMAMTTQARDTAWHAVGARWGLASDPATAGRAVAELLTTDIRDDLARATSPILLVMAAEGVAPAMRDAMRDRYAGQLAAAPQARVIVAERARHFVMLDDPAFLHAAIADFLAAHPAVRR